MKQEPRVKPIVSKATGKTTWWVENVGPGNAFSGPWETEEKAKEALKKYFPAWEE